MTDSKMHKSAGKGRIFSGIQPTGNLHLGNYLGAYSQLGCFAA
jgi:tryptophanyl-tRNA synthetase